ncbi:MAG TPA: energy transducer TonB [Bryobacteraceae bacterium]|nr:energy transducer TonB [Bryobacteraceae bacterium]
MRRIGRGGEIAAIVYVDAKGQPQKLKMIETIGFGIEQYVAACASSMTFLPATKDGAPVAGEYTLRFSLHVAN